MKFMPVMSVCKLFFTTVKQNYFLHISGMQFNIKLLYNNKPFGLLPLH